MAVKCGGVGNVDWTGIDVVENADDVRIAPRKMGTMTNEISFTCRRGLK